MALIEYDAYKQKLRDLEPELKKLGDALDIDAVAQEAARSLTAQAAAQAGHISVTGTAGTVFGVRRLLYEFAEGADPPQATAKQAAPLS